MKYLKYLRIKYLHLGRGWEGGDCLNLLLLFYREELGIELADCVPSYDENWAEQGLNFFLDHRESQGFFQVQTPKVGDALLFQVNNRVLHCGVVIDPVQGLFLHTSRKGTRIDNYVVSVWAQRVYGFYRHYQSEQKEQP